MHRGKTLRNRVLPVVVSTDNAACCMETVDISPIHCDFVGRCIRRRWSGYSGRVFSLHPSCGLAHLFPFLAHGTSERGTSADRAMPGHSCKPVLRRSNTATRNDSVGKKKVVWLRFMAAQGGHGGKHAFSRLTHLATVSSGCPLYLCNGLLQTRQKGTVLPAKLQLPRWLAIWGCQTGIGLGPITNATIC